MSLLPNQIIPQTVPIGTVDKSGRVIADKDWWLFWYNLAETTLGNGSSLTLPSLIALEEADADAADADAIALRAPIQNLQIQQLDAPQVATSDLPEIYRALLLAQDSLLPDSPANAQPITVLTPGGSPWTYTAPYAGHVAVTAGTVSGIAIKRQGSSVATGLTVGIFPVCRADALTITYSSTPTVTFIPWSSQ